MPKSNPVADLAAQLVQTLERLRGQGADAYPPTLRALAQPGSPPELVAKALKKKPFADRLLVAVKHPDSPIALVEDAERLADSPGLIECALSLLCTPQKRLHPPAKLVSKVDKALKPAFGAALQRRLAGRGGVAPSLPPSVGVVEVRGKPQLYLRSLPPPAVELSHKLVVMLETMRTRGEGAYPPSLKALIAQTDPAAAPALLKETLALPPYTGRTLAVAPRDPEAPVALAEDRDALLASPALLEYTLTAVRKPDHQAVPLTDLKKKVARPMQAAFEAALIARVSARRMTPVVGCLYVKKKPHLFLLADLNTSASGGRKPPDTSTLSATLGSYQGAYATRSPAADFVAAFDEAFERLDRQKGSHNLINLLELRQAVPADRAAFDAGLQRLRREGRYSLGAAEGRHGVTPEERAAGIVEEGTLLLFVSRKTQ